MSSCLILDWRFHRSAQGKFVYFCNQTTHKSTNVCYNVVMQVRSVSQVTRLVKGVIDSEPGLQDIWVNGEISNYKRAASGHCYFTLKDQSAELRCVMWRNAANRLRFGPQQGDLVDAHGSVSVYERGGSYQLYVDHLEQSGSQGVLWQQFLELRARLEAEGLFAEELKRPLPEWPRRIGIVTSATGAALRDMLNILQARYPLVEVVLAPSLVQGQRAPAELVRAIERLGALNDIDVVIVARGGGSLEDLWAFNDEAVARAIAACPYPVVTGVGHETDFTIADFVADLRTPTPTAAAAAVVPDQRDLSVQLLAMVERAAERFTAHLQGKRMALDRARRDLSYSDPRRGLREKRQRMDDLVQRGQRAMAHRFELLHTRVAKGRVQLRSVDPAQVLARGFALIEDAETGRRLTSARDADVGQCLAVHLRDGRLRTRIEETELDS